LNKYKETYKKEISKKIKVIAIGQFSKRRLCTISGLDKKDFRALKKGIEIEVEKIIYDKNKDILKEVI